MLLASWLSSLSATFRPRRFRQRLRISPAIEQLETRRLLSGPEADLKITSAASTSGSTAVVGDGQTVGLQWTVENIGTFAPTPSWTDTVYLSSHNTFDASAVRLDSVYSSQSFPLGINASYTANDTVTIPNTTLTGANYLLVVANSGDSLPESDYTNNTAAVPITLSDPNVKLTVSNAAVSQSSASVGGGTPLSVSWTTTNNGTDAAAGTWHDSVYLSSKPTLDGTAIALNSGGMQQGLAAGASYNGALEVTIPNTSLTGSNYLLVSTDNSGSQFNGETTNNVAAIPITLTAASPADLTVTGSLPGNPTSASVGQTLPISYTVTNSGAGATIASWNDAVYASPTTTFNVATAVNVTRFSMYTPLAASASYTVTHDVTLPTSAAGFQALFVVTNDGQTLPETNTANDVSAAIPLAIGAIPNVNLAASNVTAPGSANLGDQVSVGW